MTFFGILLLGVGGFAVYKFMKADVTAKPSSDFGGGAAAALPPAGLNLKLNDVVRYLGDTYMVEGRLTLSEDGDTWWEYMLVDGDEIRWLSVEDDDELEVALWEEIDYPLSADPPETIEWEGVSYRAVEKGKARVTRDGKSGRKEGMSCRYWDYEGAGGEMLAVESWSGDFEVSLGRELDEGTYEILSGELVES